MSDNGVYKYTPGIQLKILAAFWRDTQLFNLYRDTVKPKYFSKAIHIDLCRIIFDYREKYKTSPTLDVLVEEVNSMCEKSKSKAKVQDEYLDAIDNMSRFSLDDIEYIRDKILTFGKRQALVDAIMQSANILDKEPETQYAKIEQMIRKAMMVGEDSLDLGKSIFDNIEDRFISYSNDEDVIERIPTGLDILDEKLKGGVGRTEMIVIVAPPGRGKTTMLISMGAAALESGYKVLHVSLENNEDQIIRNYDMRLLKKPHSYIRDNVRNSVKAMKNVEKYRKGSLRVKKYPTKTLTVRQLRNYLDQLKTVADFVPDVLIIDYGMIMKPEREFAEKRSGIEGIYEDLRAIADEYDCALYTAAQGNRGSLSKKVVTIGDIAECFAIANTADIALAICQTAKEKEKRIMRGFLAKNRDSADGLILKGTINYETKQINFTEIVTAEDMNDSSKDDEDEDDIWE